MPSTLATLSLGLIALVRPSIAGYVLEDSYTPANWFSKFDFFTGADPTQGFVSYVQPWPHHLGFGTHASRLRHLAGLLDGRPRLAE